MFIKIKESVSDSGKLELDTKYYVTGNKYSYDDFKKISENKMIIKNIKDAIDKKGLNMKNIIIS